MIFCGSVDKDGDDRGAGGRATSSPGENGHFPMKSNQGAGTPESYGYLSTYWSRVRAQDPGCGPARDPCCFFLALKKIINHFHSLSRAWTAWKVKTHVKRGICTGRPTGFLSILLHINSFPALILLPRDLFMEKIPASGKLSSSV